MHSKRPAKVRSPNLLPQHPTVLCIQWAIIFEATSCHSVVPTSVAWASEDKCPPPPRAPLPSQTFLLQPQVRITILIPISRVVGRGVEEGLIQLFAEFSLDIPSLCLTTPPRLPGKCSGCYFIWNYWNPTVSCQLFPLPRLSWETGTMDGLSC